MSLKIKHMLAAPKLGEVSCNDGGVAAPSLGEVPERRRGPERSCAVCKAKTDKQNLIRIVKSPDNSLVIDIAKKLPGRGVYICPDSECIEKAKKSNALSKILNASGYAENFWETLNENAENFAENKLLKLKSILGLARKAGVLLIGSERIEKFFSGQKKVLILTANDCSEGVRNFLAAHESFPHMILDLNINELSEVIGSRGGVQILGLPLN